MGGREPILLPDHTDRVSIVLVNPHHDGNIGAVARTMLNFGFTDLRIVGHSGEWSQDVRNRAKHAQNVIDDIGVFETLSDAISDSSLVIGTSGKREIGDRTELRHFLLPEELPEQLDGVEGKIALVFGPEGVGLLNDELRACDLLVIIPTWEGYPILNLSHAVTVICYAWFTQSTDVITAGAEERLLSPELRNRFRQEVHRLSRNVPTRDHRRSGIEETLLRVILRGLPKDEEIHRILSVISESADAFEEE